MSDGAIAITVKDISANLIPVERIGDGMCRGYEVRMGVIPPENHLVVFIEGRKYVVNTAQIVTEITKHHHVEKLEREGRSDEIKETDISSNLAVANHTSYDRAVSLYDGITKQGWTDREKAITRISKAIRAAELSARLAALDERKEANSILGGSENGNHSN